MSTQATHEQLSDEFTRYARTFGFGASWNEQTLAVWVANFYDAGFELQDLREAIKQLTTSDPLEPRQAVSVAAHYSALLTRAYAHRRVRSDSTVSKRKEDDWGERCDFTPAICSGGYVEVPHPRQVNGGEWLTHVCAGSLMFYKTVVTCRCRLGKRTFDRAGGRLMGLDYYEQFVTGFWREMLADAARQKAAQAEAKGEARPRGSPPQLGRGPLPERGPAALDVAAALPKAAQPAPPPPPAQPPAPAPAGKKRPPPPPF